MAVAVVVVLVVVLVLLLASVGAEAVLLVLVLLEVTCVAVLVDVSSPSKTSSLSVSPVPFGVTLPAAGIRKIRSTSTVVETAGWPLGVLPIATSLILSAATTGSSMTLPVVARRYERSGHRQGACWYRRRRRCCWSYDCGRSLLCFSSSSAE